jgi:hypothetical protein
VIGLRRLSDNEDSCIPEDSALRQSSIIRVCDGLGATSNCGLSIQRRIVTSFWIVPTTQWLDSYQTPSLDETMTDHTNEKSSPAALAAGARELLVALQLTRNRNKRTHYLSSGPTILIRFRSSILTGGSDFVDLPVSHSANSNISQRSILRNLSSRISELTRGCLSPSL